MNKEEDLIRGMGRWDLTAIVINCLIGAGIFGLPSKVYALIGSYSLFTFIACTLVISLIVLCYSEVASRFSRTGGPYLYAREAFGPAVAFEVGWLYWIVRNASFAANCNLFVTYLGFFWPTVNDTSLRIPIIIAVIGGLTFVNVNGIRQSTMITNFLTIGKLVPLLFFVCVGLFFVEPANIHFDTIPQYSSFTSAVLLLLYAFVGFEVAVMPAGESKDPQKDFPFALIVGLGIVALVYIFIQIVSIGTYPELATSERPLADAASNFIGRFGAGFIAIGALISILGNLNVNVLGASRILYAMGERREFPSFFAKVHPKFRTPHVAILFNTSIITVLTIQSSFLSAVTIATITRLLIYATTCLSLPIFRKRSDVSKADFNVPFGVVVAVLSLLLIGWLLTNVDYSKEGLSVVIIGFVGFLLYAVNRVARSASPHERTPSPRKLDRM